MCNDFVWSLVGVLLTAQGVGRVFPSGEHLSFHSSTAEAAAALSELGTNVFTGFVEDEGAKLQSLHKSKVPYAKTEADGLPSRAYAASREAQVRSETL